jgi:5,10-methylenetetrahydromethanopterin reductase
VRDGAREVGRDPASVEIAAICAVHVGEDVRAGLDACRWAAAVGANQADFVMRANPSHGLPEPLTRAVGAHRYEDYNYETGHLDSGAAHARALPDEVIEDFAIVGPPERCLQRIRELATLGVGELSTAYLNGAFEQMERVGTELVPELARF